MPADSVGMLEKGMSKAEVLELLGPPDTVGLRLEGSVFIYRYHNEEGKGLDVSATPGSFEYETLNRQTDRVVVFFDKKGIVTDSAVY
ncbi:MAG: outer membrane protein assembly factor BamE [Kiritimatiellia bacterium]